MARGSAMRKKFSKRFNPSTGGKPHQTPMADDPSISSSFLINYRKISLFVSFLFLVSVIVLLSISLNVRTAFGSGGDSNKINVYTVEVVNEFPHDPNAFTQGLLYAGNDTLFESTGLYRRSSVRRVALNTGKVEALHRMQNSDFGEGLTLLGERLFQVTWLQNTGFIYDRNNLNRVGRFTNQMQDGWGLATDGEVLFGSDGTSTLYQIDPKTMKVIRKQIVKYDGNEVHNLNELEYIKGEVWANVWMTDCIARISRKDGNVLSWILLKNLRERVTAASTQQIDVLNGIAYDSDRDRIFVTGKLWPTLFEIKLQPMKTKFDGDIHQMCLREPVHFAKP